MPCLSASAGSVVIDSDSCPLTVFPTTFWTLSTQPLVASVAPAAPAARNERRLTPVSGEVGSQFISLCNTSYHLIYNNIAYSNPIPVTLKNLFNQGYIIFELFGSMIINFVRGIN